MAKAQRAVTALRCYGNFSSNRTPNRYNETYCGRKRTVKEGLQATIRLVIDPALDATTGKYFDGLNEAKANAQAYDSKARHRLAALTQELIGAVMERKLKRKAGLRGL